MPIKSTAGPLAACVKEAFAEGGAAVFPRVRGAGR